MKHPVLGLLLLLGTCQLSLAQTPSDQLHRLDRSVISALVDEIGETEVIYFRPGDAARTPQRIARSQLWKIVFSNGATEVLNTPLPEQAAISADPSPPHVPSASPTDPVPHPRRRDTFFTLHVGGVLPELHRGGAGNTDSFSDDRFLSYRAGFSIEAVARRHYGLRIELGYVRRGGHETFSTSTGATPNGHTVRSTTTLHYAQASVFPLLLKAGSPRLRGFVGVGGYAAWLVGYGQKYSVNGRGRFDSGPAFQHHLRTTDYGGALGAGVYWKKSILELRFEAGLPPVYEYTNGRTVRSRAVSLMYHL